MKLEKVHLVATYETQKELNDYFDIHNDDERRMLYLGSALTWNMIAHMLEQQDKTSCHLYAPHKLEQEK